MTAVRPSIRRLLLLLLLLLLRVIAAVVVEASSSFIFQRRHSHSYTPVQTSAQLLPGKSREGFPDVQRGEGEVASFMTKVTHSKYQQQSKHSYFSNMFVHNYNLASVAFKCVFPALKVTSRLRLGLRPRGPRPH